MVGTMLKNTLNGWVLKERLDKVNKMQEKIQQPRKQMFLI